MRRLIYALSIVFLVEVPGIQVLLQITMSSLHLMYILNSKPFDVLFDNRLEIINESTILILMTSLLIFTNSEDQGLDDHI